MRVAADVNRAQQSGVALPIAVLAEQVDGPDRLIEAAALIGEVPVQVVGLPVAIEGDADLDPLSEEELAEFFVQLHPVGVEPQVQLTGRLDRRAQRRRDVGEPRCTREQGLTAVQDNLHGGQPMLASMLGDPRAGLVNHGRRYYLRARPPALVGVLIDVAVVAGQIAPAVHLEDELPERPDAPGHGEKPV